MTQIFHPLTNSLAKVTIFGALFFVVAGLAAAYAVATSDYYTQAHIVRPQPVDFSHRHHVAGLGLDCRFCHTSVENSSFAGVPATEVCMNCHSQIWSDSPKLALVRDSLKTGQPLQWTRVTDLPDYVHFKHDIHIHKGIACTECHGQVDEMPLMWREKSMQMKWCLDCHRTTEEHVRPQSEVFSMKAFAGSLTEKKELASRYRLRHPTDCSACHY